MFELLPLAFLIMLPEINSFSFVISVKVFISSAFLKDIFSEHRLLEFQYFPDVALLSSCLHCSWWEICSHPYLFSLCTLYVFPSPPHPIATFEIVLIITNIENNWLWCAIVYFSSYALCLGLVELHGSWVYSLHQI